jgi:hypothetical protein
VVGRGRLAGRMVGRWALECPPLGRRRPDRVQTHRPGGPVELGVSGRLDVERSAMSVARPVTAGCPQEDLVGGDGVQAGVRRPHPGESGRPAGLRACPACHSEVLEVPTGRSRVGCAGRRAAPARRPAFSHRSGRRARVGWVGQRVSVIGSCPSAWPTPAAHDSPPAPNAPTPRHPRPLERPASEPQNGGDGHGWRRPGGRRDLIRGVGACRRQAEPAPTPTTRRKEPAWAATPP